jgi:hypothetical protein
MILVEVHGLLKGHTTRSLRDDIIGKINGLKTEDPADIKISFTTDEVHDCLGNESSFCVVVAGRNCSQKDLVSVLKVINGYCFDKEKFTFFQSDTLPAHVYHEIHRSR